MTALVSIVTGGIYAIEKDIVTAYVYLAYTSLKKRMMNPHICQFRGHAVKLAVSGYSSFDEES